jgi:hypothetical protein
MLIAPHLMTTDPRRTVDRATEYLPWIRHRAVVCRAVKAVATLGIRKWDAVVDLDHAAHTRRNRTARGHRAISRRGVGRPRFLIVSP